MLEKQPISRRNVLSRFRDECGAGDGGRFPATFCLRYSRILRAEQFAKERGLFFGSATPIYAVLFIHQSKKN
jgi:hypothetical protein